MERWISRTSWNPASDDVTPRCASAIPDSRERLSFRKRPRSGRDALGDGPGDNEVSWDGEIVSLAQLEAKASELVEQVRPMKTEPMVGLSSNSDVPLARGIVVLKVLADAGITSFFVSDPQSRRIERERAKPAPPYPTRPSAPRKPGR